VVIGETELSGPQIWESGAVYGLTVCSALSLVIAWGLLKRRRWVRPLLMFQPVLLDVPFRIQNVFLGFPYLGPTAMEHLAVSSGWALVVGWYVYGSRNREFFVA
jgi:hypothetical protein